MSFNSSSPALYRLRSASGYATYSNTDVWRGT
jgi:hypothetical protein